MDSYARLKFGMPPDPVPLDMFLTALIGAFRTQIGAIIAGNVKQPCTCGATHWKADPNAMPCRGEDEDRTEDHIHEVVWLVCMNCGAVYDLFECKLAPDLILQGALVPTEGDSNFVQLVHETVGFTAPGVRH